VCVDSSGIDNNPTVFYHLMPGSTAQTNKFHTFYLQQRAEQSVTWADIKVNHPLDYESIKEYNLTIRVEVCLVKPVQIFAQINLFYGRKYELFVKSLSNLSFSNIVKLFHNIESINKIVCCVDDRISIFTHSI